MSSFRGYEIEITFSSVENDVYNKIDELIEKEKK
jgi:hypothetical protein